MPFQGVCQPTSEVHQALKTVAFTKSEIWESAFGTLYGTDTGIPETSHRLLDAIIAEGNYEALYQRNRDTELESREFLLEFEQKHPNMLKNESIDGIIEWLKQNRCSVPKNDPLLNYPAASS